MNKYLILENGMTFKGEGFGAPGDVTAEIVFTTAMTGYLETLTDKSYAGQAIVQPFPLIGNYWIIPEGTNPECAAKKIKSFTLFVSRDALNMEGLSEATLEKFISMGFIHEYADLFHLTEHRDAIVDMEGFGEKSYTNLVDSIEKARNTTLPRLIYGLGIANIGLVNAKMLCRHFDYDLDALQSAKEEELSDIEGVGDVIAGAFVSYMNNPANKEKIDHLLPELHLEKPESSTENQNLAGLSFVVTGTLNSFENRNALKEEIEKRGGKVTGSVTSKTECLINNDVTSSSSKNKKAKELNVPILSEEDFLQKYFG